jgi:hypothetical protein
MVVNKQAAIASFELKFGVGRLDRLRRTNTGSQYLVEIVRSFSFGLAGIDRV